jgi:hypothetical protein
MRSVTVNVVGMVNAVLRSGRCSSPNLLQPTPPKVQAATVRIEFFKYGVGVAESISKGTKELCFVRIRFVEDYRYGVILAVQFG